MKKLFTLFAAVLASISLWGATVTMDSSLGTSTIPLTTSPYIYNNTTAGVVIYPAIAIEANWTKTNSPGSGSGEWKPVLYNAVNGTSLTSAKGLYSSTSSNPSYYKPQSEKYYTITFTNCTQVKVSGTGGGTTANKQLAYVVKEGSTLIDSAVVTTKKDLTNPETATISSLSASKTYTLKICGTGAYDSYILEVAFYYPICDDPHSSLSADPVSAFVNDEVELLFSSDIAGDPNWSVKKDGVAAEAGVDYTMGDARFHGLVAGEFEITATQDADGTYCAVEESVTVTVNAKTPVTAVSVAGPAEGFVGAELVYTATAANATQFEWYLDGTKQGSDSAKFIFTPAEVKTYSIVCKARNSFNAAEEWIASAAKEVIVTKQVLDVTDTYIWKKGSGYTGCVDNPNVDANANKATTTLDYSTATFVGMSQMGRAATDNTNISLTFTAKSGLYIESICTYGKLEESKGAQISWDGENWENLAAYSEGKKEFEAPQEAYPASFTIKFLGEKSGSGGLWWRNALVSLKSIPEAEISYNANGGTGTMEPTINVVAACTFTAPEGKEFDVWNTAANGEGKNYNAGDFIATNTTLYAIWRTVGVKNNDATLKALAVDGFTLTPSFAADVLEYSITKAYGAANPTVDKVTATPNDVKALEPEISIANDTIIIVVTAEDEVTTQTYKIAILSADAPRVLNEVVMSNKYLAYLAGDPTAVNAFYLEGEDVPTVESANVNDGASWTVADGKLKVIGADEKFDEYPLNIEAVAPLAFTATEIVFDGTETWVKSGYGFDGGWKFSKTDADYSREKAGKTHVEMFLPACDTIIVTAAEGSTERDARFYANGEALGEKVKLAKAGTKVVVEQSKAFMLTIASAQTSGDGVIGSIQLIIAGEQTAIVNTDAAAKAVKVVRDGQLLIIKNGRTYNVLGAEVE